MSIASAKAFYEQLSQDPSVLDGISADAPEKSMELLRERGFDFTAEELHEVLPDHLKPCLESDELSDADMEPVVGGIAVMTVVGIAGLCVGLVNLAFNIKRELEA